MFVATVSRINLLESLLSPKCWRLFFDNAFSGNRHLRGLTSEAVVYSDHGDPQKVLRRTTLDLPSELKAGEVLVKMLAAPINPADINMIQGVYPVRPSLPAVGGNEGVGEIIEVGSSIQELKPGDWVIPNHSGWGTWKTHAMCSASELIKIPNDLSVSAAATISVNPCTAYRMLTDFEQLRAGDVIIQNGANSGVGQAVIQIAAELSLQTVNIVRMRPDIDRLVATLKGLGATHVITDEFIRSPEMPTLMKSLPKPKLGLNCVGGKQIAELLKYIAKRGSLVTYGGMSKQPLMVPTGSLIFNDIKLRGYWMTQWNKEHLNTTEMAEMWKFIAGMSRSGRLQSPVHALVPFEQFADAVAKSMEPLTSEKQILLIDKTAGQK